MLGDSRGLVGWCEGCEYVGGLRRGVDDLDADMREEV
jgi:hypothetical protein